MSSVPRFKIPIVDLRAQYARIRDEIRRAIDQVNESQQFILGPAVTNFEEQMAAYLKCRHAIGVASGSDALLLALMGVKIGIGDAVITTPFSFFSTVSSIVRVGAKPLFVDIDPDTYLLSASAVAQVLSERGEMRGEQTIDAWSGLRIAALLPVHLFGCCCAMDELTSLSHRFRLTLIEDVAQACGARVSIAGAEQFAGTFGAFGCYSFFPSKTLGGFGDGGLVTANENSLADTVRMLRMHGERSRYHHDAIGINSRLDSLQAAVLSIKQRYLEKWCEERIARANVYHQLFSQSRMLGNGLLAIPPLTTGKSHVFNNYVIRAERRDPLKSFLGEQGIQTEIYYPLPLHLQNCFVGLGYKRGDFPQAERAAAEVLALPLYPELTDRQQEKVVATISSFYHR